MATVKNGWLIYPPEQEHLLAQALDCATYLGATLEPLEQASFIANAPDYLGKTRHVVTLLESVDLGPVLRCAHEQGATVGLLPVHAKSKVCRLFKIPRVLEEAMPLALESDSGMKLDLLLCNDEPVIWMITLGDVPFIELRQIAYEQGLLWQRIKTIPEGVRALFHLQPKVVTVTTAKETTIKTAVIGAMVIENDIESLTPHFASQTASVLDGKLCAVLAAPSSIMDYLSFFLMVMTPTPHQPRSISYIKTARMTLESAVAIDYYMDGQRRSAQHLAFQVIPKAVEVNVGEEFMAAHKPAEFDKDVVKIQTLPQGEEQLKRLRQRLPLFSTAAEQDFKELFGMLRNYAHLSVPFVLLVVLSAMLATLGLFLDNAPVVIGAMLLAPLMGPLVALSMGFLRNDRRLLTSALQVFGTGTGLTLLVAALTALFLPYEQITSEMHTRLEPNLLDLGVAIIAGIAAAYAHAREHVLKSLPGVAVAVALVPPACVVGVGLGWMNWAVISGAGLLFLANLVGIILAAMFAFLCLGFAPVTKAHRELGFSVLLTVLIAVPLYHAFTNTVVYQRIEKTISGQTYQVNGKTVELTDVSARPVGDKIEIRGQLHSPEPVVAEDVAELRNIIGSQLDETVVLDVSLRLVR